MADNDAAISRSAVISDRLNLSVRGSLGRGMLVTIDTCPCCCFTGQRGDQHKMDAGEVAARTTKCWLRS